MQQPATPTLVPGDQPPTRDDAEPSEAETNYEQESDGPSREVRRPYEFENAAKNQRRRTHQACEQHQAEYHLDRPANRASDAQTEPPPRSRAIHGHVGYTVTAAALGA